MLLVKNNLKKIKKSIDDASPEARVLRDDEYLNYLKFSHLQSLTKPQSFDIETSIASPKARVLRVKSTQTINTADKGVDTGNDFDEVIPPYASLMYSEDFDRNEKMVQVWTKMFKQNLTPPPSSSSSCNGSEGFMSKTARRGFRLAEFALNTAITGANVAEFLWTATSPPEYDINAETDEEQPSSSTNNPIHRDRSRSRDSDLDNEMGHRLLQRGASRSRSITPSSGKASSAKTTPRKKSK